MTESLVFLNQSSFFMTPDWESGHGATIWKAIKIIVELEVQVPNRYPCLVLWGSHLLCVSTIGACLWDDMFGWKQLCWSSERTSLPFKGSSTGKRSSLTACWRSSSSSPGTTPWTRWRLQSSTAPRWWEESSFLFRKYSSRKLVLSIQTFSSSIVTKWKTKRSHCQVS